MPNGTSQWSRREILTTAAGAAAAELVAGCAANKRPAPEESPRATHHAATSTVSLKVNGQSHALQLEPRVTLLDALREHLQMTGTKVGCNHGQCGACTVLMDGKRVDSCLILAVMAQGKEITTIEGLAHGQELHPLQSAFIKHDAFQCGYCTPGQICSGVALIKEGHCKTDDEIREQMAGNICRCGAYPNIVAALRQAMGQMEDA